MTVTAPVRLLHSLPYAPGICMFHWVALPFRASLRGTPISDQTGSFSSVSLVGGLEGLPNIPPTIDGNYTAGLGLGICSLQIPSMGTSLVTEDSSSVPQQQVPLASSSRPPVYAGLSCELLTSSIDGLQPLLGIQDSPGPLPGTASAAPCIHMGGRPDHLDPTLVAPWDGVNVVTHYFILCG